MKLSLHRTTFFYSHAYTFALSEPFTHTGALATYNASDDVTAYGGYVLGWDSGFEDNGDAFLGGLSMDLTDDFTLTYATVAGRIDEPSTDGTTLATDGYMHSLVGQLSLSDQLSYVLQSDLLDVTVSDGEKGNSIGINQYLIYSVNDCIGLGARFEWWNFDISDAVDPDDNVDLNLYALTLGVNYRPHANVIVRPEVRSDWVFGRGSELSSGGDQMDSFGIDTIFMF